VGKSEAEAAATLHRVAFGTDYMTTGNRLALMHTSAYVPEMDLVAVAPDGRLAAYTLGSINSEENARTGRKDGHTDPVATHPDFQRLGLARALLLTCMRMLKERGMETAKLGTGSDNTAMQKTAESAGFVIESRILWLRKPVE
jgi:ribosomal protein S18 acetylase RimI-like enzyme